MAAIRERILVELRGGLWHTTHPDRFKRILDMGQISPIPETPNPDGWQTMGGQPYRSFAHTLGAVSLFDFDQFDPESYARRCPMSDWQTFVPYREKWGAAVWIEIKRESIASQFISGNDLVDEWKKRDAYQHNIMPYIEAVHVGPLANTAFKRAFRVGNEDDEFHDLSIR